MPYTSASAVVIHYKEALYQVYAPLPLPSLPVLLIVTCITRRYTYRYTNDARAELNAALSISRKLPKTAFLFGFNEHRQILVLVVVTFGHTCSLFNRHTQRYR